MGAEIPSTNQQELWNKKHANGEHEGLRARPSLFAESVHEYFPKGATILEIGCGSGADASFLANGGRDVLATDISSVVIDQDKGYFEHETSLSFEQLDASRYPLPFEDEQFDGIYSNLALHYYDDETTQRVFSELHRILREGGTLAFACKSVADPKYGEGEEVEKDMFLFKGHLRHFFSPAYVEGLLEGMFDVALLQEEKDGYNGAPSAFVWCVATKRTE